MRHACSHADEEGTPRTGSAAGAAPPLDDASASPAAPDAADAARPSPPGAVLRSSRPLLTEEDFEPVPDSDIRSRQASVHQFLASPSTASAPHRMPSGLGQRPASGLLSPARANDAPLSPPPPPPANGHPLAPHHQNVLQMLEPGTTSPPPAPQPPRSQLPPSALGKPPAPPAAAATPPPPYNKKGLTGLAANVAAVGAAGGVLAGARPPTSADSFGDPDNPRYSDPKRQSPGGRSGGERGSAPEGGDGEGEDGESVVGELPGQQHAAWRAAEEHDTQFVNFLQVRRGRRGRGSALGAPG